MAPATASSREFRALRELHLAQMVNDRFPARQSYGFEMVDAPPAAAFRPIQRHQSKIYAESNLSNFLRVFAEFTSMQTLTIYPRVLVRNEAAP
jgi:hypothetical protein